MPSSANDNAPKDNNAKGELPLRPCPVCGKLGDRKYRPFCSKHCADVDLARWLGGRYSIAARPGLDDEEDDTPPPPSEPRRE